jgi:hypothetical protein
MNIIIGIIVCVLAGWAMKNISSWHSNHPAIFRQGGSKERRRSGGSTAHIVRG